MEQISKFILKHRKLVLLIFLIAIVVSAILVPQVKVNYKLSDYVPDEAPSTKAVKVMEQEFKQAIPNAQVLIPDVTLPEALAYKEEIRQSAAVSEVLWLDDSIDIYKPLDWADKATVEGYYKDRDALFQVTVRDEDQPKALQALQSIANGTASVSGPLVEQAKAQMAVSSEMLTILAFAIPLSIIILLLATHAWIEPLILLLSIGVAVILNMGSNILFGEISFITQSVATVLQLAVSMDYAIFMLHRFNQYRKAGYATAIAMEMAISKAFSTITASALTTVLGFLALVFMRFKLGPDLGFVLAKGVIFSLLSVIFFLPVLTSYLAKLVDKTSHRSFIPSFAKLGRGIVKIRWGILVIVALMIIPSFFAQKKNNFIYGMGAYETGSREERDRDLIRAKFGAHMQMAILVPNGDPVKEKSLINALNKDPDVKSVISLLGMVSAEIPVQVLPESQTRQLKSPGYSRFIVIINSLAEGEHAFELASRLRTTIYSVYPENAHLVGENFSTLDMRDTIRTDDAIVNGLAILAVGLVLLFTFKSISIPLILLLTIEGSIWLNLGIPYFSDQSLSYIGYLVISTVQLGATIDYGILYTQHYMDNRKLYGKKEAAARSLAEALPSLLPPAMILTAVGYILGLVSSITIVSELGTVLGRGAALSFSVVATFLPALLMLCDGIIKGSTIKTAFVDAHKLPPIQTQSFLAEVKDDEK